MEHNQPEGNTQEGRNRTVISETGIDFKCPDCAGSLKYDIDKQLMLCEMCGSEFPVRRLQDPSEAKVSRHPGEMETVEYHCPSCGASLHTTSTGVTSFCSFCGSDVVLEERMTRMRRKMNR